MDKKRYLVECCNCHHRFYWRETDMKPCPKCSCKHGIYKKHNVALIYSYKKIESVE